MLFAANTEDHTTPGKGDGDGETADFLHLLEALGDRARAGTLPMPKLRKLTDLLSAELAEVEAYHGRTPPRT